jgi:hypothetical protein
MARPLLDDPDQSPDDTTLAAHLGKAMAAWHEFVSWAVAVVDGAEFRWRYYRDGKAWLCKVARKDKTICWVSVWEGSFRTTFYFTERCDKEIDQLDIDPGLRQAYASATASSKLRPLTVEVTDATLLPDVYALMKYKVQGSPTR